MRSSQLSLGELRSLQSIDVLFRTFLRFVPKNSRNKRFSDVFTQRINVVRLTTKTVFVSYLFLVDSIPGLPKTTSNQEAVFESPQTQIHYWRTQQWKNTSMTIITDYLKHRIGGSKAWESTPPKAAFFYMAGVFSIQFSKL